MRTVQLVAQIPRFGHGARVRNVRTQLGEMAMLGAYLRPASALITAGMLVFGLGAAAYADEDPASPDTATQKPDPVWGAAMAAMVQGPSTVTLRDQAQLNLPAGFRFIPAKEGAAVMDRMGNQTDKNFLGLVLPAEKGEWFATLDFDPAGYIKDGDAKEWNADELLKNIKEGTLAGNEHRKELGVPPIEVTRWVESPKYDSGSHRLVWSAEVRDLGGHEEDPAINYNTYVLGREGYISLNLVTAASSIESDKPIAHQLLSAVDFNSGKRYGDFNSSTDKVAAYGLAALIGGIAAKKLGLLAMVGLFLVKFAKLIFVAVLGFGATIAKFFKGKRGTEPSA
jgi:uncharacterized membrane-anchored protein